jgi:transcriptional regulator with XRE-family HTH domain
MSNTIEIDNNSSDQKSGSTGANIRRIRNERGLTAKEFAARIGTSAPQITRLEKGQRQLTVFWLNRIAMGLDVAINDLLNEKAVPSLVSVTYEAGRNEGDELSKADHTPLKLPQDDRFPNVLRYGVLIGENHAGGRFAQGSIVICAPLADINEAMALGTHYHVRRKSKDGFHSMICALDQDTSGSLRLVPSTNNSLLKRSMPYEGTSNTSVILAGRVIGVYSIE